MKCTNCGFECNDMVKYCPNCGNDLKNHSYSQYQQKPPVEPISLNPAADRVLVALKDKLFLALCILVSAKCLFAFSAEGLPVIDVLFTIFLWIVYANAKKGYADERHLRCISGTVYANYVIVNVVCIIMVVCGLITGAAFALSSGTQIIEEFGAELNEQMGETLAFAQIPEEIMSYIGLIFAIAIILFSAIILVINLVGMAKIHRFAKSVYMGIIFQNPNFENPIAAKNWTLFYGICSAISVLMVTDSGLEAFISTACGAAAAIIASILINKYFVINQYHAYDYNNLN